MSSGWQRVQLRDVVAPVQRSEAPLPGTSYRQLGVRLWGEGAYERETVDGGSTKYRTLAKIEADDLVVNKIWARNGSVAVIPPELAGCYVSGEFPSYVANGERVSARWLHWLTKTPGFWTQCDAKSQGTSGKNRIKPEEFLSVEIPLPPLAEQQRIVARIEEVAGKVEEAVLLGQTCALAIGALWVSACRSEFGSNRVWPRWTVEESCEAIIDYRGRTPPVSDSGVPHVTSASIRNGRIDWSRTRFVSEETYDLYMTRGIPRVGDVIFTMEAPLGQTAVVLDGRKFSMAQRTLLLRPRAELTSEYFALALTSPEVREQIFSLATQTTVKGIASKRLRNVDLPVPTLAEQRELVGRLTGMRRGLESVGALRSMALSETEALVPAVLNRAFKGGL